MRKKCDAVAPIFDFCDSVELIFKKSDTVRQIWDFHDNVGIIYSKVPYALAGMDNNMFVSTYMLTLPDKETLQEFILSELK